MKFTRRSTAEGVTDGFDLSGKTVVITGVNSGLGQESMRVLASRGAHVIGLARTVEKARHACSNVKGEATGLACELSDFSSVRNCAKAIRAMGMPIDMLITNAGIMAPRELSLAHGVESQFATNHLGHFILVHHLLNRVKQAVSGRVVILSSAAHTMSVSEGIDFDNLDGHRGYSPWRFYGQSKLANLLHARALARRLEGTGVTANALHPGVIRTNLGRDAGGFLMTLMGLFAKPFEKTVPQGAATQCFVAAHPAVEGVSGEYFSDCAITRTSAWGQDAELGEKLWQESLRLTAGYLD
jgi:WW domain-containing oxidoreductase